MNGLIALVGSGEYLPVMDEIDRHLLRSTQRDERAPNVVCIPAAAGEEGDESVNRWLEWVLPTLKPSVPMSPPPALSTMKAPTPPNGSPSSTQPI